MEKFILAATEFIELSNLLKVMGLCNTGGMAKAVIAEGRVMVNGKTELRKRCKLRKGDIVDFGDRQILVA
jgi:ribosome-associated protein